MKVTNINITKPLPGGRLFLRISKNWTPFTCFPSFKVIKDPNSHLSPPISLQIRAEQLTEPRNYFEIICTCTIKQLFCEWKRTSCRLIHQKIHFNSSTTNQCQLKIWFWLFYNITHKERLYSPISQSEEPTFCCTSLGIEKGIGSTQNIKTNSSHITTVTFRPERKTLRPSNFSLIAAWSHRNLPLGKSDTN